MYNIDFNMIPTRSENLIPKSSKSIVFFYTICSDLTRRCFQCFLENFSLKLSFG